MQTPSRLCPISPLRAHPQLRPPHRHRNAGLEKCEDARHWPATPTVDRHAAACRLLGSLPRGPRASCPRCVITSPRSSSHQLTTPEELGGTLFASSRRCPSTKPRVRGLQCGHAAGVVIGCVIGLATRGCWPIECAIYRQERSSAGEVACVAAPREGVLGCAAEAPGGAQWNQREDSRACRLTAVAPVPSSETYRAVLHGVQPERLHKGEHGADEATRPDRGDFRRSVRGSRGRSPYRKALHFRHEEAGRQGPIACTDAQLLHP